MKKTRSRRMTGRYLLSKFIVLGVVAGLCLEIPVAAAGSLPSGEAKSSAWTDSGNGESAAENSATENNAIESSAAENNAVENNTAENNSTENTATDNTAAGINAVGDSTTENDPNTPAANNTTAPALRDGDTDAENTSIVMGVSLTGADQSQVAQVAEALTTSGLQAAGYQYLVLNNWQSSSRNQLTKKLAFDQGLFPAQEGSLATLKAAGFKIGLNSSISDLTYGGKPGSMYFEELDAETFVEWGIDYLSYDYSHVSDVGQDKNSVGSYPTAVPTINTIGINKFPISTAMETDYAPSTATLTGSAAISGGALTGLSSNGGTAAFNVTAAEDGAYLLSIEYVKSGGANRERLIQAVVNGTDVVNIEFPRSSGWNSPARVVGIVNLKSGANTIKLHNPVTNQASDAQVRYQAMATALADAVGESGEAPLLAVNDWGKAASKNWVSNLSSAFSWRSGADIAGQSGLTAAYNSARLAITGTRASATADLGPVKLSDDAAFVRDQLSLWAINHAPLLLAGSPADLVANLADSNINSLLQKAAYLEIAKDSLGLQGRVAATYDNVDIVVKPMADGKAAVFAINKGTEAASPTVPLNTVLTNVQKVDPQLTLKVNSPSYSVLDVWNGTDYAELPRDFQLSPIPARGTALYILKESGQTFDKLIPVSFDLEEGNPSGIYSSEEEVNFTAVAENLGTVNVTAGIMELDLPEGASVTKVTVNGAETTAAAQVALGALNSAATATVVWTVKMPLKTVDNPWEINTGGATEDCIFGLTGSVTYTGESTAADLTAPSSILVRVAPAVPEPTADSPVYISDLPWLAHQTGWGTIQRDKPLEAAEFKVDGVTYADAKGIGTHATSDDSAYVEVYIGGGNYALETFVGINDDKGGAPSSVNFKVYADGQLVEDADLGVLVQGELRQIRADLSGARVLKLVADGVGQDSNDHADWIDLKLIPASELSVNIARDAAITTAATNNGNTANLINTTSDFIKKTENPDAPNDWKYANDASKAWDNGEFHPNGDKAETARWFQFNWDEPMDISALAVWTGAGRVHGIKSFKAYLSYDGETFETAPFYEAYETVDDAQRPFGWKSDYNNEYFECKNFMTDQTGVKAVKIEYDGYDDNAWGNFALVKEFHIFGKPTNQ